MYDRFKRKINPGDYVLYLRYFKFNAFVLNLLLKNVSEDKYVNIFDNEIEIFESKLELYNSNLYKITLSEEMLKGYMNNISNSYRLDKITDIFGRDIKVGDFVLYSSYKRNEFRYGIVYSSNLVYSEFGFLDEALLVYIVDNPTSLERKKREKVVEMYNKTFSFIGQVGSVYQDLEKPLFYIDLGYVNLNFIPKSSFKYIHKMFDKYQQNNHMYISLYYDSELDKQSNIGNLLFNTRLTEKGRGEMLRFMMKNSLKSFERKLDKELRRRYVIGFENILVDKDLSYKYPCIAKIENLENMIYGKTFDYKDFALNFYK